MTPDEMNQIGLWLGLISGLLLIPEVVNLIPLDRFESAVTKLLIKLEGFANIPYKLHPESWKRAFLKKVERNTSSLLWQF